MSEEKHKGERIAKRIARAGLCSRRDAERWIAEGRVLVNGVAISSAALNVVEGDKIMVDGQVLPDAVRTRLFLYHKPPGLVTTHKDEQGRETVFDGLPGDMPRVVSVGRLDLNTEGLLLLTNDGELARYLELPDTGWKRTYRVRVHGKVNEKRLESLQRGISVEGVRYKSIEAVLEAPPEDGGRAQQGANSWLRVTLREGKNREIRRVMEALGLKVTRLIRTDYGVFRLGKLSRGAVSEVSIADLRRHLGGYFAARNIVLEDDSVVPNEKRTGGQNRKKSKNHGQKSRKNVKTGSKERKFSKKSEKS